MLWFIYNVLFAIAFTLLLPRFIFRMWRRGGYIRHFRQRFGIFSAEEIARIREHSRIWIHAVSVGEVFVALRFIEEFRSREPSAAFVLTTVTSTGHAVAEKRMARQDVLLYFPLDLPWIVRRELAQLQPRALILVEGELWPNLIRLAREKGIPVVLVNGRLSARSARGYGMVRAFFRRGVNMLNLVCVQSAYDERRMLSLGADRNLVKVIGSAKYDVATLDTAAVAKARQALDAAGIGPDQPLIVAGSTWPGEERIMLDVYGRLRRSFPALRLVLVPRHVERARGIAAEIGRHEFSFKLKRALNATGQAADPSSPCDVLLVDTTGELAGFYGCATAIFVGKSLTHHGGQNIIEPALYAKPIVVGPYMENFPGVVDDFSEAGALLRVKDEAELETALHSLLQDENMRLAYGRRTAEVVRNKSGAIPATVNLVRGVLAEKHIP